jgi:hypothetical protein
LLKKKAVEEIKQEKKQEGSVLRRTGVRVSSSMKCGGGFTSAEEVLHTGLIRDKRIRDMHDSRCLKMGLRLFRVGDRSVWALNLKNAHRKLGLPYKKKVKHYYSNDYKRKVA